MTSSVTRAPSSLGLRRLLVAALLLVSGLVPVVVVQEREAQAATAQYPDLATLPPRDLRFSTTTIDGTSHRVLRFSNTVLNNGPGKLDVFGRIDPRTESGPAEQRIYDDAGNYTPRSAGTLYWHAAHSHFHYEGWGRYELWTKADYDNWVSSGRSVGQARKTGVKTTSCILDEELVRDLPNTPYPGPYRATGCDLQPDGTLHEGLSPGWGDTYDWFRDEQWIDLDQTPLADGVYVLRSVTDPGNQLHESPGGSDASKESPTANEGVTTFRVSSGRLVDSDVPTGTLTLDRTADTTADTVVTATVVGRDDVSGVDTVRLSNDGVTWRSSAYTTSASTPTELSWDLADPAYGGTPTTGTKTVYAQFRDVTGKWGPTTSDTIVLGTSTGSPPPPPSGGYAGAVAADRPVSYWRLGEASGTTAADAVGSSPGTYRGTYALGQPSLIPTESGTSLGLSGSGSVRVPDAPALRLGAPLSLEAWIRPTTLPGTGGWASIVTKAESYSLQFNGQQLEMTVIQNGVRKRLKAPAGTVSTGQTYHVVGSYDGSVFRLYVNGSMVASGSQTGPASATTAPLVIGSWDGATEFFSGRIDDVAVYPSALTATQVSAHWQAGTGGPAPTTQTVTAALTGTGSGRVTSSPAGIDCPTTCSAAFPSGSSVTLSAAPASGSSFTSWADGPCAGSSASTCTFNALAATRATASFATSGTTTPPPTSAYVTAVAADAPVAHWRLGETSGTTAADRTGAHPGTYVNGPALGRPSLLTSDPDPAVTLDGTDDHVRVPNASALALGSSLTLEAWIMPAALPASGGWASVLTKPESYSLQFAGPQLELTVIQSGVRKRLRAPSGAVAVGRVHHVVGTYDGAVQRLYVDGVQVASAALTGPATTTTSTLQIGSWSGATEPFRGTVDEVAVYRTPLSAARVAAHNSAGRSAP